MKKQIVFTLVFIFLISGISAPQESLGVFQKGSCFDLLQVCNDCTYVNISRVMYPNNSIAVSGVEMTRSGSDFNYTFCNTSVLGSYKASGYGDLDGTRTSFVYNFDITGTGFEFDEPRSMMYIALLIILVFLFIVAVVSIPMLPSKDNYDDEEQLVSINRLKYIRPVLWVVAWFLLMSIVFSSSNIALAYMGSELLGDLLFKFFYIMLALSLPMVVFWFIYIFYNIFQDRTMKKYIERGWEA